MGEEVNSKLILVLALLVVLVVTVSTWLLLNKLNTMETSTQMPQTAAVIDAEPLEEQPVHGGNVQMTILPPPGGGT